MSDEPQDEGPDWALLPDRPVEFFGLADGFAPLDLKRAYTRLVRRFKPERHPDEFMRLRAAFEVLDERLRYGAASPFSMDLRGAPREDAGSDSPPARDPARRGAADGGEVTDAVEPRPALDPRALVAALGPAAARARIAAEVAHAPALWCALALLDDVLDDDPLAMHRTLIEGARVSRGQPAVLELLHALLREQLEANDAARLLVELAAATAGPRHAGDSGREAGFAPFEYWRLTDHLWTDLLERVRFDGFRALLARCAREVGEAGRASELVLLVRLRRRATFKADEEWLASVESDLTEALRCLPPWVEGELDLALWLGGYRAVRDEFLARQPFCEALDRALVAIVIGEDVAADREFLAAQIACVERREELFEALSPPGAATDVPTGILAWYAGEWEARQGAPTPAAHPTGSMRQRVIEFSRRLDKRADRSLAGRLFHFACIVLLGVLVGLGVTLGGLTRPWLGDNAVPLMVSIAILVVIGFRRGWFARVVIWMAPPFTRRLHRAVWRPLTADFMRDSRIERDTLFDALATEGSALDGFAYNALSADRGLLLYALAVRTVD